MWFLLEGSMFLGAQLKASLVSSVAQGMTTFFPPRFATNIFHESEFLFPAIESILELGECARDHLRILIADGLPHLLPWARDMLRLVAPNARVVHSSQGKSWESKLAREVCQ